MVNFNPNDLPDEGMDDSPIAMALTIVLFFVMVFWLASAASPLAQFLGPTKLHDLDTLARSFSFLLIVIVPLAIMGLVLKMVSPEEEYKKAATFAQQSIAKFLISFNEKTEVARKAYRTATNIPEYLENAEEFAERKAKEKAKQALKYGERRYAGAEKKVKAKEAQLRKVEKEIEVGKRQTRTTRAIVARFRRKKKANKGD